jgi:hypothetical protein
MAPFGSPADAAAARTAAFGPNAEPAWRFDRLRGLVGNRAGAPAAPLRIRYRI